MFKFCIHRGRGFLRLVQAMFWTLGAVTITIQPDESCQVLGTVGSAIPVFTQLL